MCESNKGMVEAMSHEASKWSFFLAIFTLNLKAGFEPGVCMLFQTFKWGYIVSNT